jgi:phosphopantothenoylcysteine decarboxylase/phosphopantothenate--cysteine ligase
VTGGGTREPLDAVRYIGNHSTGRTAARLCDYLTTRGHEVTWLGARDAVRPGGAVRQACFSSFEELETQLQALLATGTFDGVVHAAAVSDYSVAEVQGATTGAKLASGHDLTVRLKPNPKLLSRLRDYAGSKELRVVGFKLTAGASPEAAEAAVRRLFEHAGVDAVVHNDLSDISDAGHRFTWHLANETRESLSDHEALAGAIANWIEGGP